jgi:hypothetical protein
MTTGAYSNTFASATPTISTLTFTNITYDIPAKYNLVVEGDLSVSGNIEVRGVLPTPSQVLSADGWSSNYPALDTFNTFQKGQRTNPIIVSTLDGSYLVIDPVLGNVFYYITATSPLIVTLPNDTIDPLWDGMMITIILRSSGTLSAEDVTLNPMFKFPADKPFAYSPANGDITLISGLISYHASCVLCNYISYEALGV